MNQEGKYEDSYQKRDRLEQEYEVVSEELRKFSDAMDRDAGQEVDAIGKYMDIGMEILDLDIKRSDLFAEQIALEGNLADASISPQFSEEENQELKERIGNIKDEIEEIKAKKDDLQKESIKLKEEIPGFKGDSQGTDSIVRQKIQCLEEIEKELDELDR